MYSHTLSLILPYCYWKSINQYLYIFCIRTILLHKHLDI
nr:MAG TPA: Alternative WD40 repeat motif [Caudoviricetes sp.]